MKRSKGKVGIRHAILRAFIVSDVDDSSNIALRDKYQSAEKDVLVDRLASMIYNQTFVTRTIVIPTKMR